MIAAIDPGNTESALILFNEAENRPVRWWLDGNSAIAGVLAEIDRRTKVVIEYTPPYTLSMKGGRSFVPSEVVLTAIEIGRFLQLWDSRGGEKGVLLSRLNVKKHLLGKCSGNDAGVRDAILSRYGGTRAAAVGKKAKPGPLFGVKKDVWAALAVAITFAETAGSR